MRCEDYVTLRLELASVAVLVGLAALTVGWLYAAWHQWRQSRAMKRYLKVEAARKRKERPTTF